MRVLIIILFLMPWASFAQQEYFTSLVKSTGLEYFKKQIYAGCADPNDYQDAFDPKVLKKLTDDTRDIVLNNFSQAFEENPLIREAFKKDLNELAQDLDCFNKINHCRTKILSLSLYYYQQFRADLPQCKVNPAQADCEVEKKFRKSSFEGVHNTNYGASGIGTYKKQLIAAKNETTKKLFDLIIRKDQRNYHICNPVRSGEAYQYHLDMEGPGEFYENLESDYYLGKNLPKDCVDEKKILHQEFIRTSIDEGRFKVGLDEVEPVKKLISDYIVANENAIITDIEVTASVAKLPVYTSVNGKKVIDPQGPAKNLSVATERKDFVLKIFEELKKKHATLGKTVFVAQGKLSGPEFRPTDLNERFVTHMTPDYLDRVNAAFTSYKKLYLEEALVPTPEELTQESKFSNLYQARFKPFQGYKISLKGFRKDEMKCLNKDLKPSKSKATKQ